MIRNTILIVDDERSIRRLVQLVLTKAGYEVIAVENGAKAIETLQAGERTDSLIAIVCDLQMPRMNGMETIERFRAEFPSVPVLVLTGSLDMAIAVALIKKGISAYLLKPLDPDLLTAAVDRVARDRIYGNRESEWARFLTQLQLAES
jgi:CheY-like chemotaxis protein